MTKDEIIANLQAENEEYKKLAEKHLAEYFEVKAENEKLKEKFEQTDKAAHELLQDNANYAWDNKCYKQALDSISDIIHKTIDIGGVPLSEDDCIKILSIIKQAKGEEC